MLVEMGLAVAPSGPCAGEVLVGPGHTGPAGALRVVVRPRQRRAFRLGHLRRHQLRRVRRQASPDLLQPLGGRVVGRRDRVGGPWLGLGHRLRSGGGGGRARVGGRRGRGVRPASLRRSGRAHVRRGSRGGRPRCRGGRRPGGFERARGRAGIGPQRRRRSARLRTVERRPVHVCRTTHLRRGADRAARPRCADDGTARTRGRRHQHGGQQMTERPRRVGAPAGPDEFRHLPQRMHDVVRGVRQRCRRVRDHAAGMVEVVGIGGICDADEADDVLHTLADTLGDAPELVAARPHPVACLGDPAGASRGRLGRHRGRREDRTRGGVGGPVAAAARVHEQPPRRRQLGLGRRRGGASPRHRGTARKCATAAAACSCAATSSIRNRSQACAADRKAADARDHRPGASANRARNASAAVPVHAPTPIASSPWAVVAHPAASAVRWSTVACTAAGSPRTSACGSAVSSNSGSASIATRQPAADRRPGRCTDRRPATPARSSPATSGGRHRPRCRPTARPARPSRGIRRSGTMLAPTSSHVSPNPPGSPTTSKAMRASRL